MDDVTGAIQVLQLERARRAAIFGAAAADMAADMAARAAHLASSEKAPEARAALRLMPPEPLAAVAMNREQRKTRHLELIP